MSQATTVCDSWWNRSYQTCQGSGGTKDEDKWKEHSYCSSVHLPSSRMECSQPFTPPEKVDSNRCDPQNTIRRNIFHRLLLVYRTRDPLPMNVIRKRKEAEKFEFARWPQASKFSSWKVSVRRGMTTGSARPRLINEWSAEIDLASGAAESDFFDKHEFEFESLDPRIADVDFSSATKGCIRWRVNGKAAEKPVASRRRRRFRRLRQSWGWDLVQQGETCYGETRCPKQ